MQGLTLSKQFFEHCQPELMASIPDLMAKACVGLVGEGSECFGLDDDVSKDHDFGAAFCLWWPREFLKANLSKIEEALGKLPTSFQGYPSRLLPAYRQGRVGPLSIEGFYLRFLGLEQAPLNSAEWMKIEEYQLACCTNGEVFVDNLGQFSAIRAKLLEFYPQEVWLTKIAGKCMQMAQAGQYNLPRSLARKDDITVFLAKARFCEAALACVALLNKHYLPFYKQAAKVVVNLPILGQELHLLLQNLARETEFSLEDQVDEIEAFCGQVSDFLQQNGFSSARGAWLWDHGPSIMQKVKDPFLRKQDLLHI